MLLEGSCECGAVRFSVASREPYPFNLCYCRACRKTAGGGGYAINLKGDADSLQVTGREHVKTYQHYQRQKTGHYRQYLPVISSFP